MMCLTSALLCSGAAHVIEIYKYDKMAFADRKEYVLDLIDGARKVLTESRRRGEQQ
jgi:hypothetical protein